MLRSDRAELILSARQPLFRLSEESVSSFISVEVMVVLFVDSYLALISWMRVSLQTNPASRICGAYSSFVKVVTAVAIRFLFGLLCLFLADLLVFAALEVA